MNKLTSKQVSKLSIDSFNEDEWKPVIEFFWNRYNKRYFDQIEILENHDNYEIRNNCGFLIASIDCILIETLEQYYLGRDETVGKNDDPFKTFFTRSKAFHNVIDPNDAGRFAGLVRSGLLHQSKTKKATVINIKPSTPIIGWINPEDKSEEFKLNRRKFHKNVIKEYQNLIDNIKAQENSDLREKFKNKILTIIE
ncbi:hypothetical protein [Christiangramia sabulilitoris]|uniref:Uncharacterized protein n=1 Tax=Christiangramia sabulilitoris TaxID=2583991 RepID=A0A550I736_9FLAO|nr:hypothetical protein [Christiangramia sabulilitoris]TRO66787.1 hypothetical protein FGM01_02535 [Christiangramia sabulilitoris]